MVKKKGKGLPQGLVVKGGPPSRRSQMKTEKEALNGPLLKPTEPAEPATAERRKKKRRRSSAIGSADSAGNADAVADLPASSKANGGPPPSPLLPSDDGTSRPAEEVIAWLVWPMRPEVFWGDYWEKKPLILRRGDPGFYGQLFSKATVDRYLRGGVKFPYGERLNLARFDEATKKKVALNKGPRGTPAKPVDIDAAWKEGASMQVMHPQQFHEPAWRLLVALEGAFGALFGANAYLTPPGGQGLAPHFDDVEVFMLQVEGSKRWRLHAPPEGEEYPLPREYSRDFVPDELGELLLDCVLHPGDLLYLPRGTVHYGVVEEEGAEAFSHHLTVSTYQKTAWCHIMEKVLSVAVERAARESFEFRGGLPVGFLDYMGTWRDNAGSKGGAAEKRAGFVNRFQALMRRLEDFVDLDEACDEMGVDFMSQRGPPAVGERKIANRALQPETRVRMRDVSGVRAVLGNDPESSEPTVMVFHSLDNERDQSMCKALEDEEDVGCLRFQAAPFLPALRALIDAPVGASICLRDLPLADEGDKMALCENLHDAGLLELA